MRKIKKYYFSYLSSKVDTFFRSVIAFVILQISDLQESLEKSTQQCEQLTQNNLGLSVRPYFLIFTSIYICRSSISCFNKSEFLAFKNFFFHDNARLKLKP